MTQRLADPSHLTFPLRIGPNGAVASARAAHVREQIEQVLLTEPGERVFRPTFGVGVRQLVFEPGGSALVDIVRARVQGMLAEALRGEVDPRSLTIDVQVDSNAPERLIIDVSYTLATISLRETQRFAVGRAIGRVGGA